MLKIEVVKEKNSYKILANGKSISDGCSVTPVFFWEQEYPHGDVLHYRLKDLVYSTNIKRNEHPVIEVTRWGGQGENNVRTI